jgi:hypothetical protein
MSLSRLTFPSFCSACGQPAARRQTFKANPQFLSFESGKTLILQIPLCEACRQVARRRRKSAVLRTLLIAALLFGGLAILSCILVNIAVELAVLCALVSALLPVLWLARANGRIRRSCAPVEVRRYSPRRGTVELRFQSPHYRNACLAMSEGTIRAGQNLT